MLYLLFLLIFTLSIFILTKLYYAMQKLYWTKEGTTHLLKNDVDTLVTLQVNLVGNSTFSICNSQYVVTKKGFWNPIVQVMLQDKTVLQLTHSLWTTKGRITFADGTVYANELSSKGGLKLRFTSGENEVLTYGITFEKNRPVLTFTFGTAAIETEKLYIFAALGMVLFAAIYSEVASGDSDMTTFTQLTTFNQ